jgi:NodT family efflux transporter outer membrane factor (OMF) lipoprotein
LPHFIRRLAPLAAAVLLAGCAVGPDYSLPQIPTPAAWSDGDTQPADLSRWWRRLGDPVLDGLMDEAVAGNLDVASAKAKIREARATRREAVGALYPSLGTQAGFSRSQNGVNAPLNGSVAVSSLYNEFQGTGTLSWEADLFGANARAVEAAGDGVEAEEFQLRATLLTLIGDVATYYVEARGYQAQAELAQKNARSQRATADLTRARAEAGTASAVDADKAEATALSTEADIASDQASAAAAIHRIGVLLGRGPAYLTDRLAVTAPVPAPPGVLPKGVPADILSSRPDVRLAERQLAQATAKVGEAEAARLPSLSLTGSVSMSSSKAGALLKPSSIGWSFGPSLNIPLFEGGALEAAVEVSEAQRDQYEIALRSAVQTALEDVENASVSWSEEKGRQDRLERSAALYRRAATAVTEQYRAGSASFLDVLDAERSLYSAEEQLIESRVALASDYIALAKALGGGWDGAIDQ